MVNLIFLLLGGIVHSGKLELSTIVCGRAQWYYWEEGSCIVVNLNFLLLCVGYNWPIQDFFTFLEIPTDLEKHEHHIFGLQSAVLYEPKSRKLTFLLIPKKSISKCQNKFSTDYVYLLYLLGWFQLHWIGHFSGITLDWAFQWKMLFFLKTLYFIQ